MATPVHVPGHVARHDPAVHHCVRAVASGVVERCDAAALYACFRDFGGWTRWMASTPFVLLGDSRGTEVGALRNVVFSDTKNLLERLDAIDDGARSVTYSGVNYGYSSGAPGGGGAYPLSASPFPGSFIDYTSTVRVWRISVRPEGAPPAAFMEWSGEVWTEGNKVGEMRDFLSAFYR